LGAHLFRETHAESAKLAYVIALREINCQRGLEAVVYWAASLEGGEELELGLESAGAMGGYLNAWPEALAYIQEHDDEGIVPSDPAEAFAARKGLLMMLR